MQGKAIKTMKDIILVCPECGRVLDGMDIKSCRTYRGRIHFECPFCGCTEDEMFFKKEYSSHPYHKMINTEKMKENKGLLLALLCAGTMLSIAGLVFKRTK